MSKVNAEHATIKVGDNSFDLPIIKSTAGEDVLDIRELNKKSGLLTYDPGFVSTASCDSKITFIDGDKGILRYRGYDISDVVLNCNYLETAYLLINGELPNKQENEQFRYNITYHSMVHEQLQFLFRGFPRRAHPMSIMVGAVASLSAFYHDSLDVNEPEERELAAYRIIAKMPTLAAMAYKYSIGQPFVYPQNHMGWGENFLHMMFSVPTEEYHVNPILAKAIEDIFILHADHEQNASTSTVRLAASSGANPFACIGAGITSLWGVFHGGANEAVINMLLEIGSVDKIPHYIARAKDKNDNFRLMGFGHRVYKNYDPRAQILRDTCQKVLKSLGKENDEILTIAMELEKIALNDSYFIEKKLYPNVDFYSGIIYRALGIPSQMFTVLFAVARSAGWVAQWLEMFAEGAYKIGRPRQLYNGYDYRQFVSSKDRT